jgi:hypothetical protein
MYRHIRIQRIIFLATIVIVALGIGLFLYITLSNTFGQLQPQQQQQELRGLALDSTTNYGQSDDEGEYCAFCLVKLEADNFFKVID